MRAGRSPRLHLASLLAAATLTGLAVTGTVSSAAPPDGAGRPEVSPAVHHDTSPPLRDMPSQQRSTILHERPRRPLPVSPGSGAPDPALQTVTSPAVATTNGLNIAGVGNGDYGFAPNAAPPDTNGAVGATQYVQWVNESFAVFDKTTGALLYGPAAGNTLWKGFGGGCEVNNDGDPIAQYDKAANRWVLTQFSVTNPSTYGYLQCVAVSTTSDATGTYNRYAFSYGGTQFNDYPKLGVWPDGYYVTYNIFNNGSTFAGAKTCAFDRTAMLAGLAATQQCFQLSTSYGSLLPGDLDGTIAPPASAPNPQLNFGSNSLNLWKFHVDFGTPTNTTLTGPTNIPVAVFSPACNGGGACIPQAGTSQKLDSLADRLMYRLAYRHFADGHESLVVNHSVYVSGSRKGQVTGIRWYELRDYNGTPTVYQKGTYSPDSTSRWMGSIAMDKFGDMALGYSASSGSIYPAIRYTGRAATDALDTLQGENKILDGGGSQLANLSRWGDYSSMTVDPVDDCTFWFTTEYLKSSGTFNWSTRIASFKFPGC
ncbi:MAG: T9SS type A sorting domain-containing protein [Mycobacteriales bacterium]